MKAGKPIFEKNKSTGLLVAAIIAILFSLLFWKSFLPDFVHFSNDGPLSIQNVTWLRLPQALIGQWDDLNSIGSNSGASPLSLSSLIRWGLGPVGYSKFLAPI